MSNHVTAPPREELAALRKAGAKRKEIAITYGTSLSTVKRWLSSYNICKRSKREEREIARQIRAKETRIDRCPMHEEETTTLMERARNILGERMGEDHRGYILDGRPCSSMQLIAAAGLVLGKRVSGTDT